MKTPKNFEAGMARLDEILAKMNDSETPLTQAVKLYAEAAQVMAYCTQTLDQAQLEIQEIDAKWDAPDAPAVRNAQEDDHDAADV